MPWRPASGAVLLGRQPGVCSTLHSQAWVWRVDGSRDLPARGCSGLNKAETGGLLPETGATAPNRSLGFNWGWQRCSLCIALPSAPCLKPCRKCAGGAWTPCTSWICGVAMFRLPKGNFNSALEEVADNLFMGQANCFTAKCGGVPMPVPLDTLAACSGHAHTHGALLTLQH